MAAASWRAVHPKVPVRRPVMKSISARLPFSRAW
jgi:hypothetical protein